MDLSDSDDSSDDKKANNKKDHSKDKKNKEQNVPAPEEDEFMKYLTIKPDFPKKKDSLI